MYREHKLDSVGCLKEEEREGRWDGNRERESMKLGRDREVGWIWEELGEKKGC